MKKFHLGCLCIALLPCVELYAAKTTKESSKKPEHVRHISSDMPLEKNEEPLQRKLSTRTMDSDTHSEMDVEEPETSSHPDIKKMENMAILLEAAIKNIGNDFNQHDLEHVHNTFKALSPQQQRKFLEQFSFEKVEQHLLKNLKSIYHHLNAK